jgi:hypothetical protein
MSVMMTNSSAGCSSAISFDGSARSKARAPKAAPDTGSVAGVNADRGAGCTIPASGRGDYEPPPAQAKNGPQDGVSLASQVAAQMSCTQALT